MTPAEAFAFHHETRATLRTSVESAFEYLDDFKKLSAHMERPSGMMLGSQMQIVADEQGGRAVGWRIRMSGKVMGIALSLEEVVTEREPPRHKVWKTHNARIVVIGNYRLGFHLEPGVEGCRFRVFIDYDWPDGALTRLAAALFGKCYARWCTQRMVNDAVKHFAALPHGG